MEIKTTMGTFQVEVRAGGTDAPVAGDCSQRRACQWLGYNWGECPQLSWSRAGKLHGVAACCRLAPAAPAATAPSVALIPLPQLYQKHAPKTCKNFLELSRRGYYDGTVVSGCPPACPCDGVPLGDVPLGGPALTPAPQRCPPAVGSAAWMSSRRNAF